MEHIGKPPFEVDRLYSLMEQFEVELLLASTRHNIRYLTGGYYYPLYVWDSHGRRTQYLSFACIPRQAVEDSFYVGRPGEKEVMQEADVWMKQCYESEKIGSLWTAARTVEVLKSRRLDGSRIAVELPSLPADVFEVLKERLPRAVFVDAVPMMDALRAVKSADEIAIIREGTKRNLEAVAAVLRSGRDGVSTAELADRVAREFRDRELHFLYALVCAGPGFFRAPSEKRRWRHGNLLHVDAGGLFESYVVELCRVGYLGKPSGLADELLQGCRDLEEQVLGTLRPGVEAGVVQRSADTFLEKHPLGKYGRFIAHGIGLVHHEDPVIDARSPQLLQEGMVLSIEMEFRHEEAGHVKLEDMAVITGGGSELLGPRQEAWYISEG